MLVAGVDPTLQAVPPGLPPALRVQPVDMSVPFKELARFRVEASGIAPLSFQWRRDHEPLDGRIDSALEFPFAVPADAGHYDVVVSDANGSVTSRLARLSVVAPSSGLARRESPGPSSRRTGIVLTEIHAAPFPSPAGTDSRFLELYNSNPFPEDLSGWRFDGDVSFTIPAGTVLAGLRYLVVAPRPGDIAAAYGITNLVGGFDSSLGPGRESIWLRKRSGGVVLRTRFEEADPAWTACRIGASRVLARPSLGEGDAAAWAPSTFRGGSPGREDPPRPAEWHGVRLNEIFAEEAGRVSPFVEIRNQSPFEADLSGALLTAFPAASADFHLPAGTVLRPNGVLAVDIPALLNLIRPEGGTLALVSPDSRQILDALEYPGQLPGASWGRSLEGPERWQHQQTPSPGDRNGPSRLPEVTFSEVHFEPLGADSGTEFLEVFNRSIRRIDLGGWSLDGGVRFVFPDGFALEPGAYGVVARDVARLLLAHPGLDRSRVAGEFSGALGNQGERLTLFRPVYREFGEGIPPTLPPVRHLAPEDTLDYRPRARGNRWAAGGGSSLERTGFDGSAADPGIWRDSDETARAPWITVESSGQLTLTHPGVRSSDQLQVLLLGPGEALVDDVEVLVAGANRVVNGRFESGTNAWVFQGTHRLSRVDPDAGPDASRALHVVASDRGDHVANRIRTVLTSPIPANSIVTIRAKVRWLAGHPEILFRLRNGGLEAVGRPPTPPGSGTPGKVNSRSLELTPPAVSEVRHQPPVPPAGERLRVFGRVDTRHGIDGVTLGFRRDPSPTWTEVPMTDDGSAPDDFAGDGVFSGIIPPQPVGALVAYRVQARDRRGATSLPDRERLVRFGETTQPGAFATYRIWMTAATRDTWARREKMSNEDLPVTFVLGSDRVIQGVGAHYSGSSYSSPGYDSPTGALCGYDLSFPDDDRFLGADRATLDWPVRDDTNQREQLMFWFLEQYGLPNLYRRYVRLTVNGIRRGTLYDDVQQPDADTIEEWYPDDDDGSLWKTDCWNEFDNSGNRIDPCILNTLERFPASGPKKPARYRWNWRPRAVRDSANDFTDLFTLVDAVTATANYVPTVESLVDVDHWMRTFAMNDLASYWDGFGNPNAKNSFLYKPRGSRWQIFSWDFDVGLGVFNDPPNAALFDVNDPSLARMYRTPAFVRRYWAAIQEAVDGWFRTGTGTPIDRLLDAKYAAFQTNGVSLAAPTSIKNWIRQRRAFLVQQLASVRSDFAITTGSNGDGTTSEPVMTLTGNAPVGVATLRIQGRERTVTWTSVSNWTVRLPVHTGLNEIVVEGFDRLGTPIPGASDSLRIHFTGAPIPVPPLRFNEWLASNVSSVTNPVSGETDDWFEIHNAGSTAVDLSGFSLTDNPALPARFVVPGGFQIPGGGYLLVWADNRPEATGFGSGLHTNFRLNAGGEALALFDSLGRLVDSVTFGPQESDISEGRWPDGTTSPYFRFRFPTPGRSNLTPPDSPAGFSVTAVVRADARVIRLAWRSVPGRTYQVETSDTLLAGTWMSVLPVILAEGTETVFSEPYSTDRPRFFRIRLLP